MTFRLWLLLAMSGILMALFPFSSGMMCDNRRKDLPMVYEYFADSSDNETKGLEAGPEGFKLNGKHMKIISGAMHYFRIHPDYWRDRLRKLRASGSNTVETYVPWNLHEPIMGEFDFGNGTNDMSMFLNVRRYLEIAQEEDLLVLFRPGPYICTEWDFGGLPSWLQRDPTMKVRTDHPFYLERVKIFFDRLLLEVEDLQFTRGGSIIGVQLENEYGSFNNVALEYLEFLMKIYEDHHFVNETLLFTSDGTWHGHRGTLPDRLLMTANFQGDVDDNFGKLRELQPGKPVMAMEFWAGWFDHWFEHHHTLRPGTFLNVLDDIIGKWNGSVNFYMFHGGTNFGFMAGANFRDDAPYYDADVTSYDYDALLSEAGDYTLKYHLAKTLIEVYQEPKIKQTEMIEESVKRAYPTVGMEQYLTYDDIISQVPSTSRFPNMEKPVSMEQLPMNSGNGQSYGYIVYRKVADFSNGTNFEAGPVKDFGMLLIDNELQPTGFRESEYWINAVQNYSLSVEATGTHTLDLFIENTARINFGDDHHFLQEKGLVNGTFRLNGEDITDLEIIALEFKSAWVKSLSNWRAVTDETLRGPVLLKTSFEINEEPADTFLDMSAWHKGIVFVNDFNIGRYFKVGPQQTLYVPAPLLKRGTNTITVFEQFEPRTQIEFRDEPNLGPLAKESWKMCKVTVNKED